MRMPQAGVGPRGRHREWPDPGSFGELAVIWGIPFLQDTPGELKRGSCLSDLCNTLESLRLATIFSNLFHTFVCGAGWHPAADWKSACCRFLESFGRPIDNRPQVTNLPHICGEAALCHPVLSSQRYRPQTYSTRLALM